MSSPLMCSDDPSTGLAMSRSPLAYSSNGIDDDDDGDSDCGGDTADLDASCDSNPNIMSSNPHGIHTSSLMSTNNHTDDTSISNTNPLALPLTIATSLASSNIEHTTLSGMMSPTSPSPPFNSMSSNTNGNSHINNHHHNNNNNNSHSIKKSNGSYCVSSSGGHGSSGKSRRYKCKKCDYVSNSKDDFWRHKGSHIKPGKVMPCTYPGCDFVTEYKHHLEYHRLNHFKVKPFSCKECNYTCVNKSMLNSHMKSHSSVYQFQCKDCNYATKYCHSLKQHLRKNKHTPSPVLNLDGSVNPYPIIDVYGTRRGPRPKKKSKSVSPSSSPKENQSSKANITTTSDLSLSSLSASPTNISSSFSQDRNLLSPPISSSLKSLSSSSTLPPTSIPTTTTTIPSPVSSLLSSPAILNGISTNSNSNSSINNNKHPSHHHHHQHPHHASSISPNTINNNFDLNSNPFVQHLLHLKQQQQQHSLPQANSNKIPVQLTPPRLNRQKSTSPPMYGHKNQSTEKLSILNTNNNNNNNNNNNINHNHHSNHHHHQHLHSNIVNGNNGPTLTNNIETRISSNHHRDRCDDRSMVTSMDTSSLSPPPSQQQPSQPLTGLHPSFHSTSSLSNKRPSSPITQNYQQTNSLPFLTSNLRNQNIIPPQFTSKSFADTLSRFSSLSNLTNRQDRLFSGQDLPPIHQFQDLSLFCPDSQTSTIDYIREMNIRIGVPFLCIPLFANDLLGPTVVGPNGLIRNIPGTGTPLQSSPDNNVSEEDYGEEDGSSSDIEESFPLDLTRSNNNNTNSKPMPIIPPISTGRRDSKAVKFLID